jgi:predicted molibdopterin-dependent oxidoreductase YjgC
MAPAPVYRASGLAANERVTMSQRYLRLTQPLVRESGKRSALRPATWDDALDRAAAGLRQVAAQHGPHAFGLFNSSKSPNEMNCYKCVEACGVDAQNTFAIAGRGFDARIFTEADVPLPDSACVYWGNCIGVCPTGALMFKREHDMRAAGTWDEARQRTTDTICPYWGVGCTLTRTFRTTAS